MQGLPGPGAAAWTAAQVVTVGSVRQAPDGSWIKSTANRTTGATFDATEQTFWTTVLATAGTLEQVALSDTFALLGPIDVRDHATGATVDLPALVAAMSSTGRPAYFPEGGWTLSGAVQMNDITALKRYRFYGDGPGNTRLALPSGLGTGYLFGANVDAGGTGIDSALYAHPEIIFENLSVYGTASPNATFLKVHQRGVALQNVNFHGLKNGVVTSGYCDRSQLTNIYADNMTAGGWVFQQTGLGDGAIVDGLTAYACAGIDLTRCKGAQVSGLVSGWHKFTDSVVDFTGYHVEGDGTTSTEPLFLLQGGSYSFDAGEVYGTQYRPSIKIDDSAGTRRKTHVVIERNARFIQRLDGPASTYGAAQGVSVELAASLSPESSIVMRSPRCHLYGGTPTDSGSNLEQILPLITAGDAAVTTALNANKARLMGDWELRYRNATWEVVSPDPLSAIRTMRRATAALFIQATAATPTGFVGDLASGTYYYKFWTVNAEGLQTAATAEVSATTVSPQMVQLDTNTEFAPCRMRIVRGTSPGVYTHWVDVYVPRENPQLVDQGSYMAGQAWTAGSISAASQNETEDGLIVRGNGKMIIFKNVPPTYGAWPLGVVCINNSPAVGNSPFGWVCVVAGSAGAADSVWVPISRGTPFGFPYTVDPGSVRASAADTLSVGANNRAIYLRVLDGGAVSKIALEVVASSGNISVAVFSNTGVGRLSVPSTRLATSGAVACPAVGYAEVALGATVNVSPGDWIAISADNTTATFRTHLAAPADSLWGNGRQYREETAHPLPATAGTLVATLGRDFIMAGVA